MDAAQTDAMNGSVLRLQEAIGRRKRFWREWSDHLSANPWRFTLERDSPVDYRLMGHEMQVVPTGLGLHFSIWLQQLRSALDNTLYACVGSRQQQFPPEHENLLEFPIVTSRKDFDAAKAIRKPAVDQGVREYLEYCQPYQAVGVDGSSDHKFSPLFWLNELARVDRHRLMHVGVGSIHVPGDILLHGGAEHEVTHVAQAGHLLVGTTKLLSYRTREPLRSLDFKFRLSRPEILPEIEAWRGARAVAGSVLLEDKKRYEMYLPLSLRMEELETEVIGICGHLARLAGAEDVPFSKLRWLSYEPTLKEQRAMERQRIAERRTNGLS